MDGGASSSDELDELLLLLPLSLPLELLELLLEELDLRADWRDGAGAGAVLGCSGSGGVALVVMPGGGGVVVRAVGRFLAAAAAGVNLDAGISDAGAEPEAGLTGRL